MERKSNFELLRILSMILIIAHHFSVHGNFDLLKSTSYFNRFLLEVLASGGKLGVNIFVLISGYFLISFNKKKMLKLILEVYFYSISIPLVFYLFSGEQVFIRNVNLLLNPIFYKLWWFTSIYLVLYVLSTWINIFLKQVTEKQLRILLIGLFLVLSLAKMFKHSYIEHSTTDWFIFLYLLGAYYRKYKTFYSEKKNYNLIIALLSYLIILSSFIYFNNSNHIKNYFYFAQMNSPVLLAVTIGVFLFFKNLEIKYNKFINIIASTTFGVYLIHDHYFVRNFLWKKYLNISQYMNEKYLLFYSLGIIVTVFIICSLLDYVRQIIFKLTFDKIVG